MVGSASPTAGRRATDDEPAAGEPIVEVDDLRREFAVRRKVGRLRRRKEVVAAVDGISCRIAAGESVGYIGANGAGKSTLCSAIMGTVRVRSGRVRAFGADITKEAVHLRARRGLAYCQEGRRIFAELSVYENLAMGAPLSLGKSELAQRLDRVHETFPILAERSRQAAGSMSGGQQQMLAIGRSLLNDNKLLIVDEPTKGLAPRIVREVADAVARAAEQVPVLLVEQNLSLVRRVAGQAVVLDAGRVIHTGPALELLDDAERVRELLGVSRTVTDSPGTTTGTEGRRTA